MIDSTGSFTASPRPSHPIASIWFFLPGFAATNTIEPLGFLNATLGKVFGKANPVKTKNQIELVMRIFMGKMLYDKRRGVKKYSETSEC